MSPKALLHLVTASLFAATAAVAPASLAPSSDECGIFCADQDEIDARWSEIEFVKVPGRPSPKTYLYSASCYIDNEVRTVEGCVDGVVPEPQDQCASGPWVRPRWARLRDSGDGTPGPWVLEVGFTCPGDREFPLQLSDFQRLLIDPSPLTLQPDTGWVYAGLETIAYSSDSARGWEVELLGMQFRVAAVPTEFHWDFGDGGPESVTTEPGAPWPGHSISHTYTESGKFRPSLRTIWQGHFMASDASVWSEISGRGETLTTGSVLTVHTARTRLVEDDLS